MRANRHTKYDSSLKGRYRGAKTKAKKRGIQFDLTIEEYSIYVYGNTCSYCGGRLPKKGHGLDRRNSNKGYIKGNVLPCCTICNTAKSNLSTKAFKIHILKIAKYWASK